MTNTNEWTLPGELLQANRRVWKAIGERLCFGSVDSGEIDWAALVMDGDYRGTLGGYISCGYPITGISASPNGIAIRTTRGIYHLTGSNWYDFRLHKPSGDEDEGEEIGDDRT